jgi:4-amino-4-deoxy-L-arabinose transferase-like glycosyltransferase
MKQTKNIFLFIIILLVAVALRFYQLDKIPPHPSLDEVSIGYNAYSILQTGKDEFGYKLPILLRAYDDWRPAMYVYLVIPFVKLFGLNILAVRFPSVLLSVATVGVIYFLTKLLFKNKNDLKDNFIALPFLVMFIFTISPWDIYISRLSHEANLFFSAFIFGIYFFFAYINTQKRWSLILSAIFLAISFDSYQNGKIFIPIIGIILLLLYFKTLWKNKITLTISIAVGLLVVLPVLIASNNPQALIRFSATNLFSDTRTISAKSSIRLASDFKISNYLGKVVDNRRNLYGNLFVTSYLSHLNPVWLFTNGGDEQFKIPEMGLLYIFEFPLILIGLFYLIKTDSINKKSKVFIFCWFFIAILPGAITNGYPHAMRVFQILPIFSILSGFGLYQVLKFPKGKYFKGVCFAVIVIIGYALMTFYHEYFVNFPKEDAKQFQYGISEAYKYAQNNENKYDAVYVSNNGNLFESYMFYLFFNKYNPILYQKNGGSISGGFAEEHNISKYHFGNLKHLTQKNILVISNPEENVNTRIITKIYYPDGKDALWISEVR